MADQHPHPHHHRQQRSPAVARANSSGNSRIGRSSRNNNNQGKKKVSNTVGHLLHHLEGIEVIVELKTGRHHRGILSSADEYMNLELDQALHDHQEQVQHPLQAFETGAGAEAASERESPQTPKAEGTQHPDHQGAGEASTSILSTLRIRGSKIRYIHFPDNVELEPTIKQGMDRQRAAEQKYSRTVRKSK